MLAANHISNFDPWPLGDAALAEAAALLHGQGRALQPGARPDPARAAAPSRCGAASATSRRSRPRSRSAARATSSRCSPRARGARRGCARSSSTGRASGSARIALDAGVPLVPAAIKGTDRLARLEKLRVAYGDPIPVDDLVDIRRAGAPGGDRAADGADLRAATRRCDRKRRCSRSTATRSPTAPTTRCRSRCAARPGSRPGAIVGFANFLLRLWESEQPRAVLVGWDCVGEPTYRQRGLPRVPERAASSTPSCSSSSTCSRSSSAAMGFAAAKQPGYEADDFLAAAVAARGGARRRRRSSPPPTATPSSSSASGRPCSSRSRASPSSRGSARPRSASATASTRRRCRTSSRSAATRPTSSPARAGVGPKTAASLLAEYGHAGGDARRRTILRAGGGLAPLPANRDDWTPLPLSPP